MHVIGITKSFKQLHMHSETSSTAHHTNAVRAQQRQPIRARARQHRTAAAKRSGRHIAAQASYKQHSQHDTIAGGTHRELAIGASAKVQQLTRVRLAPRCKPQAGKVSGREHHKII